MKYIVYCFMAGIMENLTFFVPTVFLKMTSQPHVVAPKKGNDLMMCAWPQCHNVTTADVVHVYIYYMFWCLTLLIVLCFILQVHNRARAGHRCSCRYKYCSVMGDDPIQTWRNYSLIPGKTAVPTTLGFDILTHMTIDDKLDLNFIRIWNITLFVID